MAGIFRTVNFDRGAPVCCMGSLAPEDCDHTGETWSTDLGVRCTRCGARLFAPPNVLAKRCRAAGEEMYHLWTAAGRPRLAVPWWGDRVWVDPEIWVIVDHPLFTNVGGLPVRRDLLASFSSM